MKPTLKLLAVLMLALPALARNEQATAAPARAQADNAVPASSTGADADAPRGNDTLLEADRERAALRLVDTQGRIAGRLDGDDRLVMRYRDAPIIIQLGPNTSGGPGPVGAGGLTWASATIFYPSSDCSGPGFLSPRFEGASFIGVGGVQDGKNVIVVGDVRQAVQIRFSSVSDPSHAQCNQTPFPENFIGLPIEATVNVDPIATPPLFIR